MLCTIEYYCKRWKKINYSTIKLTFEIWNALLDARNIKMKMHIVSVIIFNINNGQHIELCNNDTILTPFLYRHLYNMIQSIPVHMIIWIHFVFSMTCLTIDQAFKFRLYTSTVIRMFDIVLVMINHGNCNTKIGCYIYIYQLFMKNEQIQLIYTDLYWQLALLIAIFIQLLCIFIHLIASYYSQYQSCYEFVSFHSFKFSGTISSVLSIKSCVGCLNDQNDCTTKKLSTNLINVYNWNAVDIIDYDCVALIQTTISSFQCNTIPRLFTLQNMFNETTNWLLILATLFIYHVECDLYL